MGLHLLGAPEQMRGLPEINASFRTDALQDIGLDQPIDDLVSGGARRIDEARNIANAGRRPLVEKGLKKIDDAVDSALPLTRRRGR